MTHFCKTHCMLCTHGINALNGRYCKYLHALTEYTGTKPEACKFEPINQNNTQQ